MVLSDQAILTALAVGDLVIRPRTENWIQPTSVDLRLGPELLIATPDGFRRHCLEDDGPYRLHQHAFVLAATLEWIEIPTSLVGVLVGKSSRAREGIQVEAAGFVDPGWRGNLTLEIAHLSPMPATLEAGMAIAQIRFEWIEGGLILPYGSSGLRSHYQDSHGPRESFTYADRKAP